MRNAALVAPTKNTITSPIRVDEGGAVRVGQTRVTLETVMSAYLDGATPEEIVYSYPTLQLADVYATITYYLQNKAEVEAYLKASEAEAEAIRLEIDRRQPMRDLRKILEARRLAMSQS